MPTTKKCLSEQGGFDQLDTGKISSVKNCPNALCETNVHACLDGQPAGSDNHRLPNYDQQLHRRLRGGNSNVVHTPRRDILTPKFDFRLSNQLLSSPALKVGFSRLLLCRRNVLFSVGKSVPIAEVN